MSSEVTDPLSIEFELHGPGWPFVKVAVGEKSARFPISNLFRPLDGMLLATFAIVTGESSAAFSFYREPGETRWILHAPPTWELLQVRVLEFVVDNFPPLPNEQGTEVFAFDSTPKQFAAAVSRAARQLWEGHGAKGYNESLGIGPFPMRRLLALENATNSEDPPVLQSPSAARSGWTIYPPKAK
jgi:hypothetical protein